MLGLGRLGGASVLACVLAASGCFDDPGGSSEDDGGTTDPGTASSTGSVGSTSSTSSTTSTTEEGGSSADTSAGSGESSSDAGSSDVTGSSDATTTGDGTDDGSSTSSGETSGSEGTDDGSTSSTGTTGSDTGESDDSGTGGACTMLDAREVGCGNCGTQTEVCDGSGVWVAVGECSAQGECARDDQELGGSCGDRCGGLTRTCGDTCTWGEWICGDEGECAPAADETEERPCGACGEIESRERSCDDTCHWLSWSPWSACVSGAQCDMGDVDTEQRSCGNCGTESRSRVCDDLGCAFEEWSDWSECADEGECSSGVDDEQNQFCGVCAGTQSSTRTCSDSCSWPEWGPWGPCGPCATSFRVVFDTYPDGTPVPNGHEVAGNEWSVLGIADIRAVKPGTLSYLACANVQGTKVSSSTACGGSPKSLKGRLNDNNPGSCEDVEIRIDFNVPVKSVQLEVYGQTDTYGFAAYNAGGTLLLSSSPADTCNAAVSTPSLTSSSANISHVVYGKEKSVPNIHALTWSTM